MEEYVHRTLMPPLPVKENRGTCPYDTDAPTSS